jgi:putative phage-type endonuclease
MIEQGSLEWFAQRCGKVTASCIADMMAKTKTGWGASRLNYRAKLVAERLTGIVEKGYTNAAMEWGSAMEADARTAYAFYRGVDVVLAEFVTHPTIAMSGASPDGYVGDDGLVEIKCPNTATHIETLLGQAVPGKYNLQCQWQLACTGRAWVDWVSFDPRMPEEMRLFVRRIERDEAKIAEIAENVVCFLTEIDATVAELTKLYRQQEAA